MFLTHVQQAVTRYLAAAPFFAGSDGVLPITVLAGNDKGLAGKMNAAMGRMGVCVIVVPLGGTFGPKNTSYPCFSPGRFTCRVRENQTVNRAASGTGQPADYIAEQVASALHNYQPATRGGQALGGGGIVLEDLAVGEDETGITAWDVIWTYDGGVSHEPVRLDFTGDDALP